MRVFKERVTRKSIPILEEIPYAVVLRDGKPGVAMSLESNDFEIGCLGCVNPRCMNFEESEIDCDTITGFPSDKSVNVCPVDAISWDEDHNYPVINNSYCFKCGICARRCPVGALYFDNARKLRVNTELGDRVKVKETSPENVALHNEQVLYMASHTHYGGTVLRASDSLFEGIYEKLSHLQSAYHNTVVRNLLVALGCKCSMRRIGDVYTRMDAVYCSAGGSFGAVEVEFGRDTLDAARGILDDIAVLNTRYGISKESNKALVVCLQLPNARQGYWQVVKDVKTVEGIKISTVTVGALMLLLWDAYSFEPENDRYYIDYDNMDLRNILCFQIDCEDINLSDKTLGIVEPMK